MDHRYVLQIKSIVFGRLFGAFIGAFVGAYLVYAPPNIFIVAYTFRKYSLHYPISRMIIKNIGYNGAYTRYAPTRPNIIQFNGK